MYIDAVLAHGQPVEVKTIRNEIGNHLKYAPHRKGANDGESSSEDEENSGGASFRAAKPWLLKDEQAMFSSTFADSDVMSD